MCLDSTIILLLLFWVLFLCTLICVLLLIVAKVFAKRLDRRQTSTVSTYANLGGFCDFDSQPKLN